MKYLVSIFLVCLLALLGHITWGEEPPNPLGDGRLVHLPMPPAMKAPEPPLLPPPTILNLPHPPTPVQVTAAKIEIYDPQSSLQRMAETRHADQTDWGNPRSLLESAPIVMAALANPRVVQPVPVNTPVPTPETALDQPTLYPIDAPSSETVVASVAAPPVPAPTPNVLAPNLYLPEGARDEAGAMLTLIKPELRLYEEPHIQSGASPFMLKSGARVRPLTRLRNEDDFDWIKIEQEGRTWWAQAEYFIRVDPRNHVVQGGKNLPVGQEAVDRDSALPPDYAPNDLVELARQYTFDPREYRLRREVADAFTRMADEAARKKLKLRVFSGYRDFDHQKKLYLEAVEKNGPKQNGTAAPGYSEHQLGTTIDVSNTDRSTVLSGRFGETPEGRWLHENGEKFGFRNSYTNENTDVVGYKPEPWHLRYMGPRNTVPQEAVAKN